MNDRFCCIEDIFSDPDHVVFVLKAAVLWLESGR